jgi:hypothetical protein
MNDLNEINHRDFFTRRRFMNASHLMNWSTDWTLIVSIESDICLFNDWNDDDRCLTDWEDCCLIDCEDKDRCLIDNFSLFWD